MSEFSLPSSGGSSPTAATGAEVDTGTNNTKMVTPLAIADSSLPNVQTVYSATVNLTNAQIKNLPTDGFEIVPTPGAGSMLNFQFGVCIADVLLGEYTNIDATAHGWFGTQVAVSVDCPESAGEITNWIGSSTWIAAVCFSPFLRVNAVIEQMQAASVRNITDYEDRPIKFFISNGAAGNLTGGNAANTLKITVLYTIIDV